MPSHQNPFGGYDEDTYRAIAQRWRSGKHVGAQKPVLRAYVRTVRINRHHYRGQDQETMVHSSVPGEPRRIWMGRWKPKTGWRRLPNVLEFRADQDFDGNGVQQASLDIDNVSLQSANEGSGLFHRIVRGFFAPLRGYKPPGGLRKAGGSDAEQNQWFDILRDKSTQIMVVGGYGDAVIPLFTGLINDVDITSRPDRITVIARDAGQLLTDQQVFLNAKYRGIRDPITFAYWRSVYERDPVGYGARAETSDGGHPPRFVLDNKKNTAWKSGRKNSRDAKTWIEIKVPHGRYHSIVLQPLFDNMECWICLKASNKNVQRTDPNPEYPNGRGSRKAWYGGTIVVDDWTDVEGLGNVPGTGVKHIKHIPSLKAKEMRVSLPDHGYVVGDDTVIRLYFSNLPNNDGGHRAGIVRFMGLEADMDAETRKEKWLLTTDATDAVKSVFQWIGMNDWEVENAGVPIKDPVVFNRGNYLIDIVKNLAEQLNYVYYVKPPAYFDESPEALASTDFEYSMGTIVFRQNQAMRQAGKTIERVELIDESQTLQGVNVKFTDEPLAYNIRVRGKEVKKKKGGRTLSGDRSLRFMYVYRPPWSRDEGPGGNWPLTHEYRNGNIKKYVVHHDPKLKSLDECKVAALFIAFSEALASAQIQVEMAALPMLQLDGQVAVFDKSTGISTRMWVAMKSITFRTGPNAHFRMSIGGSILDTPDLTAVRDELERAARDENYNPGLSSWQLEHWGDYYEEF